MHLPVAGRWVEHDNMTEKLTLRSALIPCLLLVLSGWTSARGDVADLAGNSGVKGGLVVHLGCGDGRDTAKLLLDDRYLVQGLAETEAQAQAARKNVLDLKLYGKVSIGLYDGKSLPYTNDLVNLLIASAGAKVPEAEIMRVLVPGGVAFVAGRKIVKPWPADIDDWTHYLHGPDNNAVAHDTRVGIPRSIQWVSEPRWGRSHEELASMSAAVCSAGRLFYIVDEAPLVSIRYLGDWKLVARDAFNGTLLWKKSIGPWTDHLRHFRSGPVDLPRRLVAVGQTVYVTLGLGKPVVALDAASGSVIREYAGTRAAEEIIFDDGVLYLAVGTSEIDRRGGGLSARGEPAPTGFRFIAAIEAATGRQLWKKDFTSAEFLLPQTLATKGSRVYYQSSAGVTCLDARSGKQFWLAPRQTPSLRMSFSAPTLVATDEVLLCADRDAGKTDPPSAGSVAWGVDGWNAKGFPRSGKCTLRAYAVADGKELWSADCNEGYNSPVDLFVVGDVVWVGTAFKGLDLETGAVRKTINTKGPRVGMPHHRCYRDKASTRFIFKGASGVEVLDLDKGWLSNNSWIRGTCQYGIMPANGLIYAPPDACACFLTVKVPGFFAAAPQRDPSGHMPFPAEPVLVKGPAYGEAPKAEAPKADDWPMYRRDVARSGAAACSLPDAPVCKWSAKVGGKLTQPVVAGGLAFVASVDTHTIHALSADDGREVWRYTAGGRIDSAATVYKGTVLFGAADGWIYCLAAADGRLVWRFQAAPKDRLVEAYGQIESAWPVHGAVLVQNDNLYAVAGRCSFLDGGLVLYRLNPASGRQLSRTILCQLDPDTGAQLVPEAGFDMEGATSDILSGDGSNVFLKYFTFDKSGARTDNPKDRLFSITSFLGEEWFVRSYWIVGEKIGAGWGGWANAANRYPAGRILCFTDEAVYGYGRTKVANGPVGHKLDEYRLFRMKRSAPTPPAGADAPESKNIRRSKQAAPLGGPRPAKAANTPKAKANGKAPAKPVPDWADTGSIVARAMVLAGDKLAVAGPADLGKKSSGILAFENEAEALAGFEGEKGVYLRLVAAADGRKLSETKLPAMPVFDGAAVAGGKLYISLKDGTVVCYGK